LGFRIKRPVKNDIEKHAIFVILLFLFMKMFFFYHLFSLIYQIICIHNSIKFQNIHQFKLNDNCKIYIIFQKKKPKESFTLYKTALVDGSLHWRLTNRHSSKTTLTPRSYFSSNFKTLNFSSCYPTFIWYSQHLFRKMPKI